MVLNSKSIGNKIAEARKKTNLSQAALAQQVSISPQAVGKWERGESMPDIPTLNKLAEILGVDLNYFSDSVFTAVPEGSDFPEAIGNLPENASPKSRKNRDWNWDMSKGNWVDADFSGLKNLREEFSSSNMKNCKFRDSDLSGLTLEKNNIELCDFSNSDIRDSRFQSSNLLDNQFNNCSFIDARFLKNNIQKCNFGEADFSGAEFLDGYIDTSNFSNAVWKFTSFKGMGLSEMVFEGTLEDCHFEGCYFQNVKFQNATILNTFFKYNRKFKKVEFTDCRVDKLTLAFLKNNEANLTGITVID